jgi:RNA polymerase sigma-70 factor, ECF subfamily
MPPADSINGLPFPTGADLALSTRPSEIEREVMGLFEELRDPLLRYAVSFGIPVHDTEEVIQEVFLCLFRHLQLRRSPKNLRGWISRGAHNLALKQRSANQKPRDQTVAVVHALPEVDQKCLLLRAEGLRYREIAAVGISLGAVSMSLA